MNSSEKKNENRARWIGAAASLLFAGLVFVILLFCGLYRPFPPPPEYGMEVNLGYSETGTGDNQEMDPMAAPVVPVPVETAPEQEDVAVTTTEPDAPALPKPIDKPKPKPVEKPKVNKPAEEKPRAEKPEEPELNPMALYPGKRKGTDNSMQGEGDKPGDQGKPTGDVNAKGYAGYGGNGGISFSLNGRTLKSLVKPEYNSEDEGVVVVRIWVNPAGNVTRVQAGVKGTTTMDQSLWKTAEEAARTSKFEPKESAPAEQVGTISYRFVRGR